MAAGLISPALPFARKEGLEILKRVYQSRAEAAVQIPASLVACYRDGYPAVHHQQVEQGSSGLRKLLWLMAIYDRNVFPAMKIAWGTYQSSVRRQHVNAHDAERVATLRAHFFGEEW